MQRDKNEMLIEAELSAGAANELLNYAGRAILGDFTSEGAIKEYTQYTDGDMDKAARAWMSEKYDAVYAVVQAAGLLTRRAAELMLQAVPAIE